MLLRVYIVTLAITCAVIGKIQSSVLKGCVCVPVSCDDMITIQKQLSEIKINCLKTTLDPTTLSKMIDQILTRQPNTTSVTISNTPLIQTPEALCCMVRLQNLNLDFNKLAGIGADCIRGLAELVSISANNNDISVVDEGTFTGLRHLNSISLSNNKIRFIGYRDFANISELPALRFVNLSANLLGDLEPWPFVRSRVAGEEGFTVILRENCFHIFTNTIGLLVNNCSLANLHLTMDLRGNCHDHYKPLVDGWGFKSVRDFSCIFFPLQKQLKMNIDFFDAIICDCVDYELIAYFRHIYITSVDLLHLERQHCWIHLFNVLSWGEQLNIKPLIDFTCDITERCPRGCKCLQRPHNKTLHVGCQKTGLRNELPIDVPTRPSDSFRYKLEFSHNHLNRLEYRSYLQNASILDASFSMIVEVSETAMKAFENIDFIFLNGNRLTSLPEAVTRYHLKFKLLNLENNSWSCSCDNAWIKNWLTSVKPRLVNPDGILCSSPRRLAGRNILGIDDEDFCVDPFERLLKETLIPIMGTLAIITFLTCLVYKFRIKVHVTLRIHPFDRDECSSEAMNFDVFLSHAEEDDAVARDILEFLERNQYKVCYHKRDFMPGGNIYESIGHATVTSKRVLCLISKNYVQSEFCLYEFRLALDRDVKVRKNRIIILKMEDDVGLTRDEDTRFIGQYMSSHTYIENWIEDWRERLLYAMPVIGLGVRETIISSIQVQGNILEASHDSTHFDYDEQLLLADD